MLFEALLEGRAEAKAEGKLEATADAILVVLQARRIPVGSADEARIRATRRAATFDRWLARAGTCRSIDELFARARPKR